MSIYDYRSIDLTKFIYGGLEFELEANESLSFRTPKTHIF